MPQKSIKNNLDLAKKIKLRRLELGMTIEDAAIKAGVGTKTWCRYEAGESIRIDKGKGICKALNWLYLPDEDNTKEKINIREYKKHESWSDYIAKHFGKLAAVSFVVGSDILSDWLDEDIAELSSMPRGSHIGQIDTSFLSSMLPQQFLMKYDYDFIYALRMTIIQLIETAKTGGPIIAHSVMEELSLYLIVESSRFLVDTMDINESDAATWDHWIFDIFDDEDLITFLYSDSFILDENHSYHFVHWMEKQFYCNN